LGISTATEGPGAEEYFLTIHEKLSKMIYFSFATKSPSPTPAKKTLLPVRGILLIFLMKNYYKSVTFVLKQNSVICDYRTGCSKYKTSPCRCRNSNCEKEKLPVETIGKS
jgi:hypothetical protein